MTPFDPLSVSPPSDRPWGVNFGGGTNSVALVVELLNRGHRPHWVLFSDTGSERPETYEATRRTARWLAERGVTLSVTCWRRQRAVEGLVGEPPPLAELETWSPGGAFESLENLCLRTGYMPSAAYGYGGCSSKAKRQPAERWRVAHGFSDTVYALGFDAGEKRRVEKRKCERAAEGEALGEEPWYPLYAWGLTRTDCVRIVEAAGLGPVPKSACFFCPYTKAHEWESLRVSHPGLFARALAIEANAVARGNAKSGLRRSQGFLRELPTVTPDVVERDPTCDCFEASTDGGVGPEKSGGTPLTPDGNNP